MRHAATLVHRWAGLFIAVFLIISGLTGAVLSWDHEIDEWLNSDLYTVDSRGAPRSPIQLASVITAEFPHAQIVYEPLHLEPGHSASYLVRPRIDPATDKPLPIGFTNISIDPVTPDNIGRAQCRDRGGQYE